MSGVGRVRFGQQAQASKEQDGAEPGEKPEVRAPAEPGLKPAADDRGHCRRDGEDHQDLRHQPLRLVALVAVADDGAPDDHADAGEQALHRTEEEKRADARRQRATHRSERKARHARQNRPPPPKRVGNRAMEQHHARVRQEIRRQRLLDMELRGAERIGHCGKRRQIRVDRKRPDRRQTGNEQRQERAVAG